MSRCFHITINDHAGAGPRSATANLSNQASESIDPGGNVVMPPVDGGKSTDPGGNAVMPPVDGGRWIIPSGSAGYGSSEAYGAAGGEVQVCSCACAAPVCTCPSGATAASATLPYGVLPGDWSGFVIVRLHEGVVADSPAETLWALAELHTPKLKGLEAVLTIALDSPPPESSKHPKHPPAEPVGVLRSRPLVELQTPAGPCGGGGALPRADCLALIHALEKKAAATAFPPLHSLTDYWRLDLRDHPDLVDEVLVRFNRLAEVDLAYRELRANDPQLTTAVVGQVFAEDQGYLDDAPLGVGAAWAWQQLTGKTSTVMVCDLEQGWNLAHKDLAAVSSLEPAYGANRSKDEPNPGHHGTAVLCQLAAADMGMNALSVKGADAQLGRFLLTSHYRGKSELFFPGTNGHVAAAIMQTLVPASSPLLKAGDVLLLEVQQALLPTEIDEANFDAVRLATALQVIVVEAAGNGGFDLDRWRDPATGRSLNRADAGFRDSGAIVVGAARAGLPHDRASFSNYGSRVDCFSWGEAVTTGGFGDLAGTGATDFYTSRFDGTSAASPIVTGVVGLVQALHEAQTGTRLEPWAMRALLSDPATGTPQGPNVAGRIGVMPDLRAIVRQALQLVPDLYLRRSPGDDGSRPGPDDEISSSPDILIWNNQQPAAAAQFGEGSLREDQPAPGDPVSSSANSLYIRLRNRGLGTGDASVQLFASPAATLITPERWIPIGAISASQIPQGDQLAVAGPASWAPPTGSTDPFWSFLAILPDEDLLAPLGPPYFPWSVGLPPGPPYFDWAEFRAFLRKPGVAWRNTHRVATASSHTLQFIIAGAPDQARAFDFEVIQRLPENAKVELQVAPALEAKLRQRQQWPGMMGKLPLPQKPRTLFNHVQLATGTRAPATFLVTAANDPLTVGHSLAIRQLWHGEEVGRITWFFGLAG